MTCTPCACTTAATPAVPRCFEGSVIFGTGDPTTDYILLFAKPNGSEMEYVVTSGGGGVVSVILTDVSATWFAPGTYSVTFLNTDYTEATFADAVPTEATCVLLAIGEGVAVGTDDITLVYG